MRQGAVGAGQMQGKACLAAHVVKQFLAECIRRGRTAGNALAVCKLKAVGLLAGAAP